MLNGFEWVHGSRTIPRQKRVAIDLPVISSGLRSFRGDVRNFSVGGFYVEGNCALQPGTRLLFNFEEPQKRWNAEGEVVYCRDLAPEGQKGVGLRFVGLSDVQMDEVLRVIIERIPTGTKQGVDKITATENQVFKKDFKLLIAGEDVDTGLYQYVPRADKFLSDLANTVEILEEVKNGTFRDRYQDYIYARYCLGDSLLNQRAIRAAKEASLFFRYFPVKQRRKILDVVHDLMVGHRDTLMELMVVEGHPVKLAEWQVDGMCTGYSRKTLDYYESCFYQNIGRQNGEELFLLRRPDGVVGICPPGNAPCSNSLLGCFALLSGNAVIVKPPLRNPISTIFLWRNIIFEAAKIYGAPEGIVNIIVGDSKQIVKEWIESEEVSDLLYFGDSDLGLEIGKKAYLGGKKPILELSGNDILLIWKDADLDGALDSLVDGFLASTQVCMVPKKALIHEDVYEAVLCRFIERAKSLKIGLPSDPEVLVNPVIRMPEYFEFLKDAVSKGAKVECGGRQVNHRGEPDENGLFIEPTVLRIDDLSAALGMRCVQEENFFPLIPLIKISGETNLGVVNINRDERLFRDDDIFYKMVAVANNNTYGLRLSIWVSSEIYLRKFVDYLHNSGLLRVNSRHVAFSELIGTHGGTRKSAGPHGEMNYLWQKTSHLQGVSIKRPTSYNSVQKPD